MAEGRWQSAEGGRQAAEGRRQRDGELGVASAVEEGGGGVGGDLPTGGRDFDDFAVGVLEIEKNGVRLARVAARGDASMDGEARSARKGASFEGTDGLAERIVAGRLAVVAIEGVDEPVAETGREDGADLVAAGAEREADEGLTGAGGEGGGGSGVVEEEFGLGMHRLVSVVTDRGELKAVGVE